MKASETGRGAEAERRQTPPVRPFASSRTLLDRMISPALRLHRYRNVREFALDEALSRRYCGDRG